MRSYFYFLRHGIPEHDDCLRGSSDFKLTQTGFTQMEKSAANIDHPIDVLISSPLRRCASFAEDYSIKNNLSLQLDSAWQELDFGTWDGQKLSWIDEYFPGQAQIYWDNPWAYTPPEGESLEQFSARLDAAYEKLLSEYLGRNVLIVTHSAVMRYMLTHFLDITPQSSAVFSGMSLPYAALFKLEVKKKDHKIKTCFHFL